MIITNFQTPPSINFKWWIKESKPLSGNSMFSVWNKNYNELEIQKLKAVKGKVEMFSSTT